MKRSKLIMAVAVVALLALAGTTDASVYWEGTASRGLGVFEGVEKAPGRAGVTNDPSGKYGQVFYLETYDGASGYETGKQRCETRGCKRPDGSNFRMAENGEYYLGWRSMWNPMPTKSGAWVCLMQLKGAGAALFSVPGGNGCPLVIRTLGDGKLWMHLTCDGDNNVWSTTFPSKGSWNSFVLRLKLTRSKSTGYVEYWYNGTKQTFNAAKGSKTQRQPASLWETEYCRTKWGVYRTGALNGSGTARAHLWRPRIGTAYSDVAP